MIIRVGFLYEATGAYDIPFYVAGSFIVFSGVMCYPLNYIKNWEYPPPPSGKDEEKAETDKINA